MRPQGRHQSTAIADKVLRQIKGLPDQLGQGIVESVHYFGVVLAMSDHVNQAAAKPVITAAEPQLFVADIKASCDFFVGKLGFGIDYCGWVDRGRHGGDYGENPTDAKSPIAGC